MSDRLILTALAGLPLFATGDDLVAAIGDGLGRAGLTLQDGDVLVIAQKIVSKVEGRLVDLADVTPGAEALALAPKVDKDPRLVELILSESTEVVRCKPGVLIVAHRLGLVMANAGIDASNIEGGDGERVSPPICPSAAMKAQLSSARPQPRTGSARPARV